MSRKEIKVKANRTWDIINLLAAAVGGSLLAFTADTPEILYGYTVGQITGAVLIATVVFRVAHLIQNEQR